VLSHGVALAVPTVNIGTYDVPISPSTSVDVYITGLGPAPADSLQGIDIFVGIASQQLVAPAGEPKILNVDVVTGTVFDGDSTFPPPGQVLAATDQIWEIDDTTIPAISDTINTNGKLFTVTFDTSGVAPGSTFAFNFHAVNFEGDTLSSNYANHVTLGHAFAGVDGFLHVTPEPSACLLAVSGLVALLGWRWQQRRRPGG